MADIFFGGTELPLQPPALNDAVSDPLLTHALDFWKAVANRRCSEAWTAVAPDRKGPIASVFPHNPAEVEFNERDLPALFAWREIERSWHLAEDIRAESGDIVCLWIPPPAPQSKLARRAPIPNGIFKALDIATHEGHDIAWKNNDLLHRYTGHRRLWPKSAKPQMSSIEMADAEVRKYMGWEFRFFYEEQWIRVVEGTDIDMDELTTINVNDGITWT